MELDIATKIALLKIEAHRLEWEARRPRACPRAAWDAEESLKAVLGKIADLQVKQQEAEKP